MKKMLIISVIVTLLMSGALAHSGESIEKRNSVHQQLVKIMEKGSFSDFNKFRQKTGFNIMPWVDNEKEFSWMQSKHRGMNNRMVIKQGINKQRNKPQFNSQGCRLKSV